MPSADGHAVRAELKQYTQPLKAQKGCVYCFKLSPVEKFEARRYTTYGRYRIRKAEKVSDLMHAEDGADRDGAHWQPSGNRAEGFCCFIMVRHDVCHYCTARSPSDPLDGQCCMLTAVLWRCSSVNLSTAVQDDIPSTTHDLAMLIAAIHQPARAQQAYGDAAAAQSSGRASQLLTAVYGHGAKRLAELFHAMIKTNNGRLWLPSAAC